MKRTVYNTMIGLMLACGLAMTSTGAMAQGRRPSTTTNAAAAGNRSVATALPKSNAVVTNNNSTSRSSMGSAVTNRSTSTVVNKPSTSVTTSTSNSSRPLAGNRSSVSTSISTSSNTRSATSSSVVRSTSNNSGNSGSTVRPNVGGNHGTSTGSNSGNNARPNTGSNNGKGHSTVPTSRPTTNNPRPKVGGTVMAGGGPNIDYNTFRWNSTHRPRFAGDRFFDSFRYNSWSWTRPIRPSVRLWRPSTIWVYRPIVTININRYSSYPTIAGVLGLRWGTSFGNALNYLYYNGYYIDGFENSIVYLTDVELMDYDWDDVMLQFDGNDNLDYVEFAYWTPSYDTSRFFGLYNYLCSIYGSPVSFNNSMYSWYGGDGIGFVNLGYQNGGDIFYTVLAFGV